MWTSKPRRVGRGSWRFGQHVCPRRAKLARQFRVGQARRSTRSNQRGSALLTVLWVCAALAAVGFALANTVRSETERVSTTVDDLRSYYLATGAVDRAAIEVLWSASNPNDPLLPKFTTRIDYQFPTGTAHVEVIPEASKLNVNSLAPDSLGRLLAGLGVEPSRIDAIMQSVLAWRDGRGSSFSALPGPTFPGAGTSFQEIEEMLAVRGITPDIFYGTYVPATDAPAPGEPRLVKRSGLVDCLSIYGAKDLIVDANTADPAVLYALGMPAAGIQALVEQRNIAPLNDAKLNGLRELFGPAAPYLRLEGHSIFTIRSTARVRLPNGQLSDLKRSVAAVVKYMPKGYDSPIHILRWYDNAWSN